MSISVSMRNFLANHIYFGTECICIFLMLINLFTVNYDIRMIPNRQHKFMLLNLKKFVFYLSKCVANTKYMFYRQHIHCLYRILLYIYFVYFILQVPTLQIIARIDHVFNEDRYTRSLMKFDMNFTVLSYKRFYILFIFIETTLFLRCTIKTATFKHENIKIK